MPSLIFRKGLDLKQEVAGVLEASYRSPLVEQIKAADYCHRRGRLTIYLAREFGFCYGVDRAVDYAYQARTRFPDRRVFLTGEIIHNPHVNNQLRQLGIRFLSDPQEPGFALTADDVVILPAFGVTIEEMMRLDRMGCTLVDTTCGSVLNVWKNVKRYARDGLTSVIHGKHWHEETQATASQATAVPGGHYLVVFDMAQAERVCHYIEHGGDRESFLVEFAASASPGFDPDVHLGRIGCANQTTMLSTESLAIGQRFGEAIRARYGEAEWASRFRAFDTICSATQDRQDAIIRLLDDTPVDLMVVIGGYNSSNTCNLARICHDRVPTYHIGDPDGLLSSDAIRFRDVVSKTEVTRTGWLPPDGPVTIGLTSGASTPDNLVEMVVHRLESFTAAR
jgi:4-hydroxy-3-methylbut-2-enyl diphosphate reductase